MTKGFYYQENYVKFFLQRNQVIQYDNFKKIEENTRNDVRIKNIINELKNWPCYEIKTHKNVDHPLHKLSFLAELGFNKRDTGIEEILKKIFKNQSEEGPFNVLINIPIRFGGSGQAKLTWVMSDAPVLIYAAIKLNQYKLNKEILTALDAIVNKVSENGWHCKASKELGKFRGPGRNSDPCPYATMFSLKMLGLTSKEKYRKEKKIGIDAIFRLWEKREIERPYLFGMGTDFKKLKLPFVWYDILNMVDTLSLYPEIYHEKIFQEMFKIIKDKETSEGYIPESIYLKAKKWDFGQKKKISEYMNAVINRIENRIENKVIVSASKTF